MDTNLNLSDKILKCKDCGKTFVFTADDQKYFAEKGYLPPKRCKSCRYIRRLNQN